MEVYGSITQKVNVNPIQVIEGLIGKTLGDYRDWIFEKDGKFYHGYESSAGSHGMDREEVISKETYDYIKALQLVKKYLEGNEKVK